MGFTGLALGAMLAQDGVVRASELPGLSIKPKAKSVIWIFLIGGMSHLESFDPKPELNKHAGKTIADSPHNSILDSPYLKKNIREFVPGQHKVQPTIYPLQIGYQKHGQCGAEISDWFPHLAKRVDDLAIVRSMWTTDNDHGAQLQFHTGRHAIEGPFPTIGSWVHWGLGSLNDNLPSFCVLGTPLADCCGGLQGHGANYLGPEHTGIQLATDPANPLPFAQPDKTVYREEQAAEFALLGKLNRLAGVEYPNDPALAARIRSYELAFQMQKAVPEAVNLATETTATHAAFGLDQKETKPFAEQLLVARRLVERGVRFVQVFHGGTGNAGAWDSHANLQANHSKLCKEVDQPIAALLGDLKQRGLLDETIVVIATEFGRTPGAERSNGRDHHPYGFSIALAGGGIQGGIVHGATDELGFHAVENRHYVTDVHATVFNLLGLDHRHMEIPGRKRLDLDFGQPIRDIMV
ncbi:MAG TPA: DUF1501 domain-containing protein [Pirellulaceae bacterium]